MTFYAYYSEFPVSTDPFTATSFTVTTPSNYEPDPPVVDSYDVEPTSVTLYVTPGAFDGTVDSTGSLTFEISYSATDEDGNVSIFDPISWYVSSSA